VKQRKGKLRESNPGATRKERNNLRERARGGPRSLSRKERNQLLRTKKTKKRMDRGSKGSGKGMQYLTVEDKTRSRLEPLWRSQA